MKEKTEINMKLKITELEIRIEQLEKLVSVPQEKKPYYSVNEFARILNITPVTVYNHCRSGKIFAIKVGKTWRIPHSSLMQ